MATYGERLLAQMERRARARAIRRRLVVLLPALVTTAWALLDLLAAIRW